MKKTSFGVVIFWFTCIYTIVYAFAKIYAIHILSVTFDGWSNIRDMSLFLDGYDMVKFISNFFLVPIMCGIMNIIYAVEIGRNKKINGVVLSVTILVSLAELVFYILNNLNGYYKMVPMFPLLLRVGFLFLFLLFYVHDKRAVAKKILYILAVGVFFVGVIQLVLNYRVVLPELMQSIKDMNGGSITFTYAEYFVLPILNRMVCGFLFCYILLPEKCFVSTD